MKCLSRKSDWVILVSRLVWEYNWSQIQIYWYIGKLWWAGLPDERKEQFGEGTPQQIQLDSRGRMWIEGDTDWCNVGFADYPKPIQHLATVLSTVSHCRKCQLCLLLPPTPLLWLNYWCKSTAAVRIYICVQFFVDTATATNTTISMTLLHIYEVEGFFCC